MLYGEDGDLEINNAEHILWATSPRRDNGGRTAAILTSFVATCKRLQIKPLTYLRDVFDRISPHPVNRLANSSSITGKPLSTPPATSSPNTKIPRFVPDSTCVYRTATAMGKMVLVRLVNAR